jgi:hypothetical protein
MPKKPETTIEGARLLLVAKSRELMQAQAETLIEENHLGIVKELLAAAETSKPDSGALKVKLEFALELAPNGKLAVASVLTFDRRLKFGSDAGPDYYDPNQPDLPMEG